ncbi:rhodanese-like domain-containing protein [Williamsia muralis]|uniref:Rhodanese-like domain-containing protein n=1 Tax=Williamsia marianensis TaxID=85044 RepID=A0ABU4EQB3_WILMA|nr:MULTISPECIES: rhodanese-like domain-containing protein [Williamsia]MDV7133426.1 rhodanese-like domain-containing protein [Williamsia muralis]PVY30726.1 rhodanese-related sulfurtransferase [Williamsia marianensis]
MSFRHYLRQAPKVSAREAIGLAQGGALVVDVRRRFEWNRTHIPGAVHIPLEDLERRSDELPDDRLLLTFCTGGLRSSAAANLLNDWGWEARNISKGLIDWRAAGGPLIGGPAAE